MSLIPTKSPKLVADAGGSAAVTLAGFNTLGRRVTASMAAMKAALTARVVDEPAKAIVSSGRSKQVARDVTEEDTNRQHNICWSRRQCHL